MRTATGYLLMALLTTGCAKVAPKAGKALTTVERSGVKAIPAVERAAVKGEAAAARSVPVAERGFGSAAKRWADRLERALDIYDKASTAYDIFQEVCASSPPAAPQFFPDVSAVQPTSQRPIRVNAAGMYVLPNNVGGFIFYSPSGAPLGFCANNTRLGELQFFNAKGQRMG